MGQMTTSLLQALLLAGQRNFHDGVMVPVLLPGKKCEAGPGKDRKTLLASACDTSYWRG